MDDHEVENLRDDRKLEHRWVTVRVEKVRDDWNAEM
jgi:hypothetical protein